MEISKDLEKSEVKEYFNGTGFDRWKRIYSNSEQVNNVQKNIRKGHQKTVDDVISWVNNYQDISKISFCDAGCGVGSLTVPLLELGVNQIQVSDISSSMIKETKQRVEKLSPNLKNKKYYYYC